MTEYNVYVGVIKNPDFEYSGEPECWRDNVDLLDEIATGMEAMVRVVNFRDDTRASRQVDWATWIIEMPLETLKRWVGPRRSSDVSAWRPFMANQTDDQIREQIGFDPRAKIDRLPPDQRYAIIAVEGI